MLSRCGGRKGRGAHGPSWTWRPVFHRLLQDRASTQMPDGGKLFSVMASGTLATPLTFVLAAACLSLESLGSSWPSPNPTSPESGWWVRQEPLLWKVGLPLPKPALPRSTWYQNHNSENTFPNKYWNWLSLSESIYRRAITQAIGSCMVLFYPQQAYERKKLRLFTTPLAPVCFRRPCCLPRNRLGDKSWYDGQSLP